MALNRLSLVLALLLLSLLGIASATYNGDASSKYGFDGRPADSPQATPYDDASSKYGFDGISAGSPQAKPEGEQKSYYGTKPAADKDKPVDKENSDHAKQPNYGTKQDNSEPEEKPAGYGGEKEPDYDTKPNPYKPKGQEKPYYGTKQEEKDNHLPIAVQGLVLCQSGSRVYPIPDALAKITCKTVDEVGVEKTLSVCSGATDAKGYFFATVSHLDKLQLKECKAYLQSSPNKDCNVPTNVNQAIDGAFLTTFTVLKEKGMKLYSVKPFFYTSKDKPASNGY